MGGWRQSESFYLGRCLMSILLGGVEGDAGALSCLAWAVLDSKGLRWGGIEGDANGIDTGLISTIRGRRWSIIGGIAS
jgi:hypothetical protein